MNVHSWITFMAMTATPELSCATSAVLMCASHSERQISHFWRQETWIYHQVMWDTMSLPEPLQTYFSHL